VPVDAFATECWIFLSSTKSRAAHIFAVLPCTSSLALHDESISMGFAQEADLYTAIVYLSLTCRDGTAFYF